MQLPQSGLTLQFRQLDGHAEAMLAELSLDRPMAAGIAALRALAVDSAGTPLAAEELPLTDYECALAALRQAELGDTMSAAHACPRCGERMELSFSLAELLVEVRHAAEAAATPRLQGTPGTQLPSAGDAARYEGDPDAPARLLANWMPANATAAQRRKADAALDQAMPLLSRSIEAPCAACSGTIYTQFHLPGFVMTELIWRTRSVFEDVHVLARGYGWSERQILDLPRSRRRRYTALLREAA